MSAHLERRIVIGLIVSEEFARQIVPYWEDGQLESPDMDHVARWCVDYYTQYNKIPGEDIKPLYLQAVDNQILSKDDAEAIEDMLDAISNEYDRIEENKFNAAYLYDQATEYLRGRGLTLLQQEIDNLVQRGRIKEAEDLQAAYVPKSFLTSRGLDVFSEEGLERIRKAFEKGNKPIVTYPGALGAMLNAHLTRGSFCAFLAPEKRGKSFLLQDLIFRALRQKANVAWFQAGDLTEDQTLRRIGIYLSRRSDMEQYCQSYWRPVGDCVHNQFNNCSLPDRNCSFGVFDASISEYEENPEQFQTMKVLIETAQSASDYNPCDARGCVRRKGAVWIQHMSEKRVLNADDAVRLTKEFFNRNKRRLQLSSHASGTLTCDEMRTCLSEWEMAGFVPDVIVVDYADIMDERGLDSRDYRHKQNAIWQGLRGLSQKQHALVVTATQSDADSYNVKTLRLKNFSEDKRKYAHVTAMWGLNQDPSGREKALGILRINELVIREGASSTENQVAVLQDLRSGRPFLESFQVNSSDVVVSKK